jgi:alpha-amylase/alpha-mannosidase (GH57 family)
MERYICIHGHFYQPPRENPWLEAIELQDTAYPYHDWNERITAECYAPNAAARILDDHDRIVDIVNNYSRISFNIGPTLLSWLEAHAPDVYGAILEADRESARRYGGHGSAIAQVYNHMIMPLADARDRRTQVYWGVEDFRHRFGRAPEGMWLAETAVDLDTLEALAEHGIRFTVLEPGQAARIRPRAGGEWQEMGGGRIDPTRPYLQRLPSGKTIAIFFYDGPVSRAVAFEELLRNGERLAGRLVGLFHDARDWPQLVNIATDGETYGHHHRHGEMALAYALHHIESNDLARLTNYGQYLELHPPEWEVEIVEDTSWSCAHGVERWRTNCGCHTGGEPGWTQEWREPLRSSLDWLRGALEPLYADAAAELLRDPSRARDDYIRLILDRSDASVAAFIAEHAREPLDEAATSRVLSLLELQHHAMLMFTSCGWFFNELSGIETVQVLQYAGRAVQLAREILAVDLEPGFLERLERAESNLLEQGNGRRIYETSVRPAIVRLVDVCAHYAVISLFEPYAERSRVYCYTVDLDDYRYFESGDARLGVGRARVTSRVTRESKLLSFGVLHRGVHDLQGGVRQFAGETAYRTMLKEIAGAFDARDFDGVVDLMDSHFRTSTYSLKSLFYDEQRRVIDRILRDTLTEAEDVYRRLYESNIELMQLLAELDIPLPNALDMAAEFVLNTTLIRVLADEDLDLGRVLVLLQEARSRDIVLDAEGLGYALTRTLQALAGRLRANPADLPVLRRLEGLAGLLNDLPFNIDLWEVQNRYFEILRSDFAVWRQRADQGDLDAAAWIDSFVALGEALSVAVDRTEGALA